MHKQQSYGAHSLASKETKSMRLLQRAQEQTISYYDHALPSSLNRETTTAGRCNVRLKAHVLGSNLALIYNLHRLCITKG
jgi:hypothetical protein